MKTLKLKSVLVVLFLATAFISCDNDDDKATTKPVIKVAFATEVKGPEKGKVNEDVNIEVSYNLENPCGKFDKFTETTIGTEKGFQILTKYESEVCILMVPELQTAIYKFKSAEKGTFNIKFKKSETEFITKTVIIE
ncbi:hypothetical protein [Flavobacterium piscis]|uniref:DUF4625 domain-containing protein n=1 Tax=Flavobacterium piscis TaxID=1114874 RepID=A0ABU1YD20_9FLAO|nr:hypothetical protein [Flavobacterium piscis]MDR7212127.1 hypothetical protein [Flavobacterium piscis]